MASEEKPFDPTPSRIAKARKEGNVVRSTEVTAVASFALGTVALFALGPSLDAAARAFIRAAASGTSRPLVFFAILGACVGGIFLAAGVGGVVANLLQSKGLLFVAPSLKFSRLKPDEGFKRMFSQASAVSAVKALLAFAVALAFALPTAHLIFTRAAGARTMSVFGFVSVLGAERAFASAIGVALVFSIVDYLVTRKQWLKKLRMSWYEIKKEFSENEGNPHLRGRRRSRHRELLVGPVADVSKAAFVVANPTHVAVALRYAPPEVGVPVVLVMGAEENAMRIRALASESGVPVVENVPLARALWATATIGRPIPRDTFVAVAEIVTAICPPARRAS